MNACALTAQKGKLHPFKLAVVNSGPLQEQYFVIKKFFFFLLNSTTEHLSSTKNLFLFKNTICSVFIIWHACICTDHMVLDNRFRILPQGRPFLPLSHAQLSLLAYSSLSRIRAHRLAISTLASTGAALVQVLFRRPCSMRLHEIELLWYF